LLYADRELHLDFDEQIFQELECQTRGFIKGKLIQPSQKRGRHGDVTEKNHEAEKPKSFNTKHLAKISPWLRKL
jgi:hypothetical protein